MRAMSLVVAMSDSSPFLTIGPHRHAGKPDIRRACQVITEWRRRLKGRGPPRIESMTAFRRRARSLALVMPVVATFYGIVVRMYYNDHGPPHFHVEHGGDRATFDFNGELTAGELTSPRARPLVVSWAALRRGSLRTTGVAAEPASHLSASRPFDSLRSMVALPAVVQAEYVNAYRIHVAFSDGSENTIDFSQWFVGPVFEPLKDVSYFRRFFIDGGTIAWPNGADIAPETLYAVTGRLVPSR